MTKFAALNSSWEIQYLNLHAFLKQILKFPQYRNLFKLIHDNYNIKLYMTNMAIS